MSTKPTHTTNGATGASIAGRGIVAALRFAALAEEVVEVAEEVVAGRKVGSAGLAGWATHVIRLTGRRVRVVLLLKLVHVLPGFIGTVGLADGLVGLRLELPHAARERIGGRRHAEAAVEGLDERGVERRPNIARV